MAPRQHRDPEATKTALIDAAEAVFMEKGFGSSTLSEIAKRAGITKSLIHHYFGSKKGLWSEVKTRRFEQYAARQTEMLQDTASSADLLRSSLAFYFDFLRQNPQIVRILAWMFLEQDQEKFLIIDKELIRLGVAKVHEAQVAGQLRGDIDPRFIVFVFLGLCQHWFQDKDHFTESFGTHGLLNDLDKDYLEAITKIFFEGILPR
jgi:TetR/AcrR family transcriptional regulator